MNDFAGSKHRGIAGEEATSCTKETAIVTTLGMLELSFAEWQAQPQLSNDFWRQKSRLPQNDRHIQRFEFSTKQCFDTSESDAHALSNFA